MRNQYSEGVSTAKRRLGHFSMENRLNLPTVQEYIEENGASVYVDPLAVSKAWVTVYEISRYDMDEARKWVFAENLVYLAHLIQALIVHEKLFCLGWEIDDSRTVFSVIDQVNHDFPENPHEYPPYILKHINDYYAQISSLPGIQMMARSGLSSQSWSMNLIRESTLSIGPYLTLMASGISSCCDPYVSEFAVPFISETHKGKSFADISMSVFRAEMGNTALKLNEIRNAPIYNTSIPMLFVKVLSLSNTPENLISYALDIREIKEARRFREWTTAIDNDSSLDNFYEAYKDVHNLAENLGKGIKRPTKEVSIGFGIGPISLSIPSRIPLTRYSRKKHLSFLSDHCWKGYCMEEIASHITRIFDVDGKDIVRRLAYFKIADLD